MSSQAERRVPAAAVALIGPQPGPHLVQVVVEDIDSIGVASLCYTPSL